MSIVSSGITLNTAYNVTGDLTGNLIFQSNGTTEAVRIDTNQNVGIGTANPGQKLEVNGWVRTGIGASATGGLELPYYSGSASSRTWRLRTDVSAYGDFSIAQATTQGGATFSDKIYIDASGNVGIGTTSPSFTAGSNGLMLSGLKPALRLSSTTTGSGTWEIYADSASSGGLGFYERQNNQTLMYIDEGGNVLVGTTTPYSGTVSNFTASTGVDIGLSSTATSKQLQFIRNATTGTAGNIYATAGSFTNYCGIEFVIENVGGGSQSGYLKFNTTSSATSAERMRINSSGQLVMATSTYGIVGQIQAGITADTSGMNSLVSVAGDQNGGYPFGARGNSTNQGLFGFFNSSNSTIGSITKSGSNVAYNTSSDYRLKENIAPMTGALAKVAQLKPVTYTWKEDGSDGEGFIAHELAEVCPHAVSGEKDAVDDNGGIKPQGIDVSFLVATLTAAIQELKAIVDAQAIEIAELKGKA